MRKGNQMYKSNWIAQTAGCRLWSPLFSRMVLWIQASALMTQSHSKLMVVQQDVWRWVLREQRSPRNSCWVAMCITRIKARNGTLGAIWVDRFCNLAHLLQAHVPTYIFWTFLNQLQYNVWEEEKEVEQAAVCRRDSPVIFNSRK